MKRVDAERDLDAPVEAVQQAIEGDMEEFIRSAGFDSVTVDGDEFVFSRNVGLATIELTVERDRDSSATLAFDAVEGMFDEMRSEYDVVPTADGSRITAWTEFTLGGTVGTILDSTVVARMRKKEFVQQFDYLETRL